MSKQAVIEQVRDLLLAWTPINSGLSQLTTGYAHPYDTLPEKLTFSAPLVLVERRRTMPAYSDALGSNCREELLPIRVDICFKEYLIDADRPNIDATDEQNALLWEDELHSFFANYPTLDGTIIKMGRIGEPRRVETRVGRRYWFQQELFTTVAFFDALYEVATS